MCVINSRYSPPCHSKKTWLNLTVFTGKCRLLRAKMAEENKSPDTDVLTEEEKLALAAIKEKFGGRWKEIRSENVDGFFSEMGERHKPHVALT